MLLTLLVLGPSIDVKFWHLAEDSPPTERIGKIIMVVDPRQSYSNEAERANWDIYDVFKLKKASRLHGL